MSAVFGLARFDDVMPDHREVGRMAKALAHHGRDGVFYEQSGMAILGTCLNRIRGIDRQELQPIETGNLVLVASARLDNRESLGRSLELVALDTTPDSALILAAYHKWGEDCASHLLGDFTFAIWNSRTRRLLLARDHMGQRPLLYHVGETFLAFAPEAKALWSLPDVPRMLSDAAIGRRLLHALGGAPDSTMFEGIRNLPGGHTLVATCDPGGVLDVEVASYWTPTPDLRHLNQNEEYYVRAYRDILGEAVSCRLRDLIDPPGLHFSGGFDSGAIAGLAGKALGSGRALIAASSVMPQGYRGTIRHAGRWVDLCERAMPWLKVHRITREGLDALTSLDRNLTERGGISPYAFVHDALNEALSGAGVRLLMDGHGGDYTLNPRGDAALARLWKKRRFGSFVRELRAYRRMGRSWSSIVKNDLLSHIAPGLRRSRWKRKWGQLPPWGNQPIRADFAHMLVANGVVDPTRLRAAPRPQTEMHDRLTEAIGRARNGGIGDVAAYYGMVLTRPFHDRRVVELALAIPEDLYLKNGRSRYLACKALADIYPREFQGRWRRNDDQIPDFQAMISRIKPRLLADIGRMERSEKLTAMVDFEKIRALLDMRGSEDHNSGWEQESQLALSGYMTARFSEWFRRDNN